MVVARNKGQGRYNLALNGLLRGALPKLGHVMKY